MMSGFTPSGSGRRTDAEVLVHLAVALSAHMRRLRSAGATLPAIFVDLTNLLQNCVRARQNPTALYDALTNLEHGAMNERLLLTKGEVADRLGVSLRTVERMIAAGRLPHVSVEGARRVRVADLKAYVEGLEQHFGTARSGGTSASPQLSTSMSEKVGRPHGDTEPPFDDVDIGELDKPKLT